MNLAMSVVLSWSRGCGRYAVPSPPRATPGARPISSTNAPTANRQAVRCRSSSGSDRPSGAQTGEGRGGGAVAEVLPDPLGALARAHDTGVDLEVVVAVRVDLVELARRLADGPVAAGGLTGHRLLQRAPDTDEDHALGVQQVEAVREPPGEAQHVVDDDVVARSRHAGDGPVEAHGGADELGGQVLVADLALGAHGVDGVDRQVEPGAVQDLQELGRDARLARARGAVEEDDRPLPGDGRDPWVGAVQRVARRGGYGGLWRHGADSAVASEVWCGNSDSLSVV